LIAALEGDRYRAGSPSPAWRPTIAAKLTVVLKDDLEGGPADETVRFRIGGTDYEIDLDATQRRVFPPTASAETSRPRVLAQGTSRMGVPVVVCLGDHWTAGQYQRCDVAGDPLRDHCRTWAY